MRRMNTRNTRTTPIHAPDHETTLRTTLPRIPLLSGADVAAARGVRRRRGLDVRHEALQGVDVALHDRVRVEELRVALVLPHRLTCRHRAPHGTLGKPGTFMQFW